MEGYTSNEQGNNGSLKKLNQKFQSLRISKEKLVTEFRLPSDTQLRIDSPLISPKPIKKRTLEEALLIDCDLVKKS